MTKAEAHSLLASAKHGAPVTPSQITVALRATGDLSPTKQSPSRKIEYRDELIKFWERFNIGDPYQ